MRWIAVWLLLGVGSAAAAQDMRYKSGTIDIATPFVALDLVVGYRL